MSLVDTTFGPLAPPLIQKWGTDMTYVLTSDEQAYDPVTGDVSLRENGVVVRALITRVRPIEADSLYQDTDLKIIMAPGQLPLGYSVKNSDYILIPGGSQVSSNLLMEDGVNPILMENGVDPIEMEFTQGSQKCKIINITNYRGDLPVLYIFIVRPQ